MEIPDIVPSPIGEIGLSIVRTNLRSKFKCYDLRFPELYRTLAQKGAKVILIPSAFIVKTGAAHWETLLKARAIENQCYVIASAQFG